MVERFVSIEEAAGSMPAFSTFSNMFYTRFVVTLA